MVTTSASNFRIDAGFESLSHESRFGHAISVLPQLATGKPPWTLHVMLNASFPNWPKESLFYHAGRE